MVRECVTVGKLNRPDNRQTTAYGILIASNRQHREWTMARSFVKALLTTVVTFLCAAASFMVIPVAMLGLAFMTGRMTDGAAAESAVAGLQLVGFSMFVWTASFLWIAWCEGWLKRWRFSVRSLLAFLTAAAILMGAIASWIAHLRQFH